MNDLEQKLRDECSLLRKQMNDLTMRMFLRTTICFKDLGKFEQADGKNMYGDKYTGNHIAIFECELKAPPQLSLIDHTYADYIDAYRMNFKNWKIVDIDNFMEGNHFFSNLVEESAFNKKVTQTLGANSAPTYKENEMQSPLFLQEILAPELREVQERMNLQDTNSNRHMSPLHKHREALIQKIAQE